MLETLTVRGLIAEHILPPAAGRAPGAIVLRRLEKGAGSFEYVTHFRNDQTGGYSTGHYFTVWPNDPPFTGARRLVEAATDFEERAKRGY